MHSQIRKRRRKKERKKEGKDRKEKICAYYTAVYPQREPLPLSDYFYKKR